MRSSQSPETHTFGKHEALEKGKFKSPHRYYLLHNARADFYREDLAVSWNLRVKIYFLLSL